MLFRCQCGEMKMYNTLWISKEGSTTLSCCPLFFPPALSPPISYSALPISLRNGAPKIRLWNLGGHCKHPQRGLDGSPTDVEFVAFFALT